MPPRTPLDSEVKHFDDEYKKERCREIYTAALNYLKAHGQAEEESQPGCLTTDWKPNPETVDGGDSKPYDQLEIAYRLSAICHQDTTTTVIEVEMRLRDPTSDSASTFSVARLQEDRTQRWFLEPNGQADYAEINDIDDLQHRTFVDIIDTVDFIVASDAEQ